MRAFFRAEASVVVDRCAGTTPWSTGPEAPGGGLRQGGEVGCFPFIALRAFLAPMIRIIETVPALGGSNNAGWGACRMVRTLGSMQSRRS